MAKLQKPRPETEHCPEVALPGVGRVRASGAPAAGVPDRTNDYGEPRAVQNRSGRDLLVEKERLVYCQGGCEYTMPMRESWLQACPRCPALVCRVCRDLGHARPSGGRCAPVLDARD
jgi:hypothetical protein